MNNRSIQITHNQIWFNFASIATLHENILTNGAIILLAIIADAAICQ
jgi:hypothetical protein